MGGNVFKDYLAGIDPSCVGRRLTTEDYPSALFAVISILKNYDFDYRTIDFIREKESHGDLDILVIKKDAHSAKFLADSLRSEGFKVEHNKEIVSVLLLTFQVDFIFVETDYADYSKNYFSWNDLGNLVGRTSKQLGLKHGHDGLYYVQRDGDRVLAEHKLSNDYFTILKILELDEEHFKKGFDTYVEMFEWVSNSPYFNASKFELDNLNHRNRVRDRKRKVYNLFLNWCNSRQMKEPVIVTDHRAFLYKHFPSLEKDINEIDRKAANYKLLYEKFNGIIISKITGLTGKPLGGFITSFKEKYSMEFLLNLPPKDIEKLVYEEFQKGSS